MAYTWRSAKLLARMLLPLEKYLEDVGHVQIVMRDNIPAKVHCTVLKDVTMIGGGTKARAKFTLDRASQTILA